MGHGALWRVFLTAVTMQVTGDATGKQISLDLTTTTTTMTIQSKGTKGAPRFSDSNKMKQTFIAWPARRTIRLKCEANGSTPLKYQWLKDGLPAIPRRLQPRLKTNMWYLRLKDLVVLDSGKYTCVVSNSYGSINHTYTLRVVEKPRTKPILKCGSPKNTSVFLGQNASMTCIVLLSGTLPDFRWLKWNGLPSTYPASLDFENGSYTLVDPLQYKTVPIEGRYGVQMTIPNVSKQDLGLYTCYVSNHLGSEYRSAFLSAKSNKTEITSEPSKFTSLKDHDTSTMTSKGMKGTEEGLPKPVAVHSDGTRLRLSLFMGVIGIWAVITTLALLWCHLYRVKMSPTKPELTTDKTTSFLLG